MKQEVSCCSASLLVVIWGSGCQMAGLMRENTEQLKTTNQAIPRNTAAVGAVTQTMQDLESTLQQVGSLKEPMQDLAALGPTFAQVTGLAGPMEELAGLRDPMVQVSALKGSLDQVAKLEKPLSDMARLEEPLKAVGQLTQPMSILARLTPVQRAASVVLTLLAFFGLLFVTMWGAVRLALRPREDQGV